VTEGCAASSVWIVQTDLTPVGLRRPVVVLGLAALVFSASACSATPETGPSASSSPSVAAPVDTLPLNNVTIPSEALGANLIGDPAQHDAIVYLPPQYFTSDDSLPVLYFLPGYGGSTMSEVSLPEDLDTAFETLDPMIIVIVNGLNSFTGSFYTDSTTTGGWSTFLADDVVPYVDSHFRTIPSRDARGIAGHSMGGFGALDNAMRHSDVFGSVFAMAPALFDENGLQELHLFTSENRVRALIALVDEASALGPDVGLDHLIASQLTFDVGYGMAFAPTDEFPYFEYPFTLAEDGTLVRDDAVLARWEAGYGGVASEVAAFAPELKSLNGIGIDCGSNDENRWIPPGCAYMDAQLTAAGIEHQYTTHTGTHNGFNRERILEHMLPFFSGIFTEATD